MEVSVSRCDFFPHRMRLKAPFVWARGEVSSTVNPFAIALLEERGYLVDGLRSKSWEEFTGPDAPEIDFVFTVCDSAGKETRPIWPGHPMTAHWGIPDPAAVKGADDEKRVVFEKAYEALLARIGMFLNLKLDTDDKAALRRRLSEIGQSFPESA
jgi:arsenate reductase